MRVDWPILGFDRSLLLRFRFQFHAWQVWCKLKVIIGAFRIDSRVWGCDSAVVLLVCGFFRAPKEIRHRFHGAE